MFHPPISFYLPKQDHEIVGNLSPEAVTAELVAKAIHGSPALVWTWLTYLRVKKAGVNCQLTNVFPNKGIVVSTACTVPLMLPVPAEVCHVCAAADSPPRFYPQLQIVQNTKQLDAYSNSFSMPEWFHVPHWPQPNLVPRSASRGEIFQNVGFVGSRNQMARELATESCAMRFREMGLRWMPTHDQFNDYSTMDCLIGIRSFDGRSYDHKPASKLVNAWLAGVPAVLGSESAFGQVGRNGEDYLEVNSLDEMFAALKRLKEQPSLRAKLVESGRTKAVSYSEDAITNRWIEVLTVHAQKIHQRWLRCHSLCRAVYHVDLYSRRMGRSLRKRLFRW